MFVSCIFVYNSYFFYDVFQIIVSIRSILYNLSFIITLFCNHKFKLLIMDMDTIETFKPVYQRFLESGMTVCDFCKSSNLLESRFYYYPLLDGVLQ